MGNPDLAQPHPLALVDLEKDGYEQAGYEQDKTARYRNVARTNPAQAVGRSEKHNECQPSNTGRDGSRWDWLWGVAQLVLVGTSVFRYPPHLSHWLYRYWSFQKDGTVPTGLPGVARFLVVSVVLEGESKLNKAEERQFRSLIADIIGYQDDVTHCNEKGYVNEMRDFQRKRDNSIEELRDWIDAVLMENREEERDAMRNDGRWE